MQMRAQNCMMTRDLDASREQDLKSTCIHRSPVASAGWLPAGHRSRLLPAPANQSTSLMTRRLLSTCRGLVGEGGIVRENGRDAKRQVGELADALLRGARGPRAIE